MQRQGSGGRADPPPRHANVGGGPFGPDEPVLLGHGSGGRLSHQLIREFFLPALGSDPLAELEDAARLRFGDARIAFTTDSFVVLPAEFPGGDIGRLAVCGTVNDLAVMGARPLYLSAAFLLEEGLPIGLLRRVVGSMRETASEAGVQIVTGDTKVVERGGLDRIFINTSGIGVIEDPAVPGAAAVRPGDRILVNGPLGDHGLAVMAAREDLHFESPILSDCAPLWSLVDALRREGIPLRWMRDPTRGGLGTALNELVENRPFGVRLREASVPVRPEVQALADILGLDPLYSANEGKLIAVVPADAASRAVARMQAHPLGREACEIGEVAADPAGRVVLETRIGGTRILDMLTGAQLPRIC